MKKSYGDKLVKIGLNIAYYRKLKGLTQEELAEKTGLSRGVIGHIEAPNMYKGFTFNTLFKIAEALEVKEFKLLQFRDEE